ncbi:MAG: hypothetical protein UFA98_01015 [Ruminococcus sp.]|nr:hypothetical protein [Ruminococcus sp.]
MKARIPLQAKVKKQVREEVAAEWQKIQKEKSVEMAQRCLKVFLYVLNRDYGFGKKRLTDFYNSCGELLATADTNEVFWEQIDRIIVDTYEFKELGRDYTYHGKAVR